MREATSSEYHGIGPGIQRLVRTLGGSATFLMAFLAAAVISTNAFFGETFGTARITPVLLGLLVLHIGRFPRLVVFRELVLYLLLFLYMILQGVWTEQPAPVIYTLWPALNSLLMMLLVSALLNYHAVSQVVAGLLAGIVAAALAHTVLTGFPFSIPAGFSYNASATVYLFGLFLVLIAGALGAPRTLTLTLGLLFWLHVVATTSIKTNLGIALGILVSSLVYFRHSLLILRRNAVAVLLLVCALAYFVLSNQSLVDAIARGMDRVALGIQILQVQQDLPGYSAFSSRQEWLSEGLEGWMRNPVFGNGVESFRAQYGITSHSTPIDLLHNSGLIGATLFYALFLSLFWRLLAARKRVSRHIRFIELAGLVCFSFISMTATVHYNAFFAAFIGISVFLLKVQGGMTAQRRAMLD